MPRATIPYDAIRSKLFQMFPEPTFRYVRLRKPDRYNNLKAPTTIYDRTSGNFKAIGYRCAVVYERFEALSEDLDRGIFRQVRDIVLVEL